MYLVAKPFIWGELEGDHVVIKTVFLKSSDVCIITRSSLASLRFKGLATKHATVKWTLAYGQVTILRAAFIANAE